ncbi:MAG: hypothetical protein II361_02915 [Alistipes sp.]|jgi:GLPGLI family protein|nr:hypothetical protein [Alistipes sp.]MBQ5830439.1 hypothetical protein [Alistipes sp.]
MKCKISHIGLIVVAVAMVATAVQLFVLGNGQGHYLTSREKLNAMQLQRWDDEHLAVIYERTFCGKSDLVHLQIDTTFHQIGKAAYKYEVLCKREYTLRSFDGSYEPMDDALAACFAEGEDSREWRVTKQRRQILGYDCRKAEALLGEELYQAWYTEELPYSRPNARTMDQRQGLILEAESRSGDFALKVKYIDEKIG